MDSPHGLFGSNARSKVLVAIGLLRESYAREIARVTSVPLVSVQRIIRNLERDGIVVGRVMGSTRLLTLNPRLYGVNELESFLTKYSTRMPELSEAISSLRRQPRRSGKEIT